MAILRNKVKTQQLRDTGLLKPSEKKRGGLIHFLTAVLFLSFGLILILKLMGKEYSFLGIIPEKVLYWIVAVGSFFGGVYMIYKEYIFRHEMTIRRL